MAQKTLQAVLVLGGRVDNSFGAIGDSLISLGYTVDQVSSQFINFGKSSLEIYKDYDKNMTELETVWGTNGKFVKDSRELTKAIDSMGAHVNEWAGSTIFHTNDVSNALVEAAHAGWDYEEMMEGIPAAMSMAQAGGMDLSVALDYVVKAQKDFGWTFEETLGYLDDWIYTANNSAGTAREFGDTFLKMGSTVRFTENTQEMLALTKAMHDMGSTGSAAGTLLKTTLMRLYAPSQKAGVLLQEVFGWTDDDIKGAGIMDDDKMINALNELERHGFKAFDENGEILPVLKTFQTLKQALIEISGLEQKAGENAEDYLDRVLHSERVLSILSEIYGIRGIQGALNTMTLLDQSTETYNELMAGAAEGTTEYVRSLMGNTLYGQTEELYSKWEKLQNLVGESLAPEFEKLQKFIGGIIDKVAGMDEAKFNAWVDGLKAVALAGTALTATGFLMKFVGFALTVPGIVSLLCIGAASLVSAMNSLKEADFEGKFGSMNLDAGKLNQYISTLGDDFNTAYGHVNDFAGALSTAVSNYEEASETFASDILNAVLTKQEFTPAEKEKLEQLGISIYGEVLKAIEASSNEASNFWAMLYGGEGVAESDPKYQQILDIINKSDADAVAQATAIGDRVKAALVKGFTSGFTQDDYNEILDAMREYNDLVAAASAQAQAEQQFIEQKKLLHKAQTASLDDVKQIAQDAAAQRESQLALFEEEYLTQKFALEYRNQEGILSDEDFANLTAENEKRYQEWVQKTGANYDEFLMALWETQIQQSDLSESYGILESLITPYLSGTESADSVLKQLEKQLGGSAYAGIGNSTTNDRARIGQTLGYWIANMGGEAAVLERIEYYRNMGNSGMADQLLRMYAMEQFANAFSQVTKTERSPFENFLGWGTGFETTGVNSNSLYSTGYVIADSNKQLLGILTGSKDAIDQKNQQITALEATLKEKQKELADAQKNLDYERSLGYQETWLPEVEARQAKVDAAQQALDEAKQELEELLNNSQIIPATVSMDVEFPTAVKDAASVYKEIDDEFKDITLDVDFQFANKGAGGASGGGLLYTILDADGGALTRLKPKAKGGRETQPAIFAEAGIPEWFIPEEHTANTARLILGAAYGSGFDLYDLAAAAGARMFAEGGTTGSLPSLSWASLSGESGGSSGEGIKVQYSPVIHAENAAGVKRELMEDKKRFEKWMNEWWEKRNLYQSIVTYQ